MTTPHTKKEPTMITNQEIQIIADTVATTTMSAQARYQVDLPVPEGQPRQLTSPTTALADMLRRLDRIEKHLVNKG